MRLFIPGKTSIKRQAVYNDEGKLIAYDYENKLKIKTRICFVVTKAGREALVAYNKRLRAGRSRTPSKRGGTGVSAGECCDTAYLM